MTAAKKKKKTPRRVDKAAAELMDGGVRTILSYRSCNTTQGGRLKWRSSFLNGLTNAHVKGHYRNGLRSKLEEGGGLPPKPRCPIRHPFSTALHSAGWEEKLPLPGLLTGGVDKVGSQKHPATYGWP